ncbi:MULTISPECIES: hypothetical protein [unclassified Mesorhizobium]|uniref:hypothetical protein n=1 Tax=unclassified Mesorhizobium TaxID=325217 RepID=UPI0033372DF9
MPTASDVAALHKPVRAAKVEAQSRLTTGGQLFLGRVDGRSTVARRYRDVLALLSDAIGGAPSDAQALLLRRAATLSVICEQAESDMAGGKPINAAAYSTSTNTLRRVLADLGLAKSRRAPTAAASKRLAGTIAGYLAG